MKFILRSLGGVLLLALGGTLATRAIMQRRVAARLRIDPAGGIDVLEKVRLGGIEQWIQIRGRTRSNPILLFLHGGPGFPEMPFAHINAALANDFVVVQWDQRGAGKSYAPSIPKNTMTLARLTADADELVRLLLRRFEVEKLYLVAHSWGSIIGAREVAQHPELFHAYVAISQVVRPPESERLMYDFALAAAHREKNTAAETTLTKIGPPPYESVDTFETMNDWINHFSPSADKEMTPQKFARAAFVSPAYSLADLVRLGLGFRFSYKYLWRDAFATDLPATIPRLDVPVYFFLGRKDHTSTASAELAARYFEQLEAPRGKELVWFEHSGHWPQLSEPQKYRRLMTAKVLQTQPKAEALP